VIDDHAACLRMLVLLIGVLTAEFLSALEPSVDADATPACVVVTPVGARLFGDLSDQSQRTSAGITRNQHLPLAKI